MKINKAQTATEYLIILAVVIVIALIVIGVLGGIPSIGGGVSKTTADAVLSSQKVGITGYAISDSDTDIRFQNNAPEKIRIDSISVGGLPRQICTDSGKVTLKPGERLKTRIGYSSNLDKINAEVQISYTNLDNNAQYTISNNDAKLMGDTSGSEFITPEGVNVWNYTYVGNTFDDGYSATVDSCGNVFIIGRIDIMGVDRDFNPYPYPNSLFINKFDRFGNLIFSKKYDSKVPSGADVDTSGNLYVTYTMSNGLYIEKFDPAGNSIWNASWSNGLSPSVGGISINADNEVFVASIIFPEEDLLLLKYNSSGSLKFNLTFDYSEYITARSINIDENNYIYVIGRIHDAGNINNFFLAKFDSSGDEIWNKSWGSNSQHDLYGVDMDSSNNLYVVGSYTGDGSDFYLAKLNSAGDIQWENSFGYSGNDYFRSVLLGKDGNIYAGGSSANPPDGIGGNDLVLFSFDSSGNELWNFTTGSIDSDYLTSANGLGADGFGNIYFSATSDNYISVYAIS